MRDGSARYAVIGPGAVRRYRRALRYDPSSLPAARHLVQLLTYHLKSPQEAARHAVRTVESYSDDPVLLERLGLFLLDEGELVRAAVLFEKAIESRDDESDSRPETRVAAGLLRLELARIQLLLEHEDRARFHLEKAVDLLGNLKETGLASPSGSRIEGSRIERATAEAWRLLAGVLLSAGRLDEAEAAFEEAHRRRPGKGGSALARARLLEKRGRPAEALAQLEIYLKSPSVDDGVEPYALLARLLAKDGEKAGEETALLRRLRRLYAVHSDNAALGGFFAEQLLQKDRPQEAEAVASRLVRNTPTPETIRLLLDLYRRGKRYRDTLRLLGSIAGAVGSFDALDLDKTPIDDDLEWVDGIIAAARTALAETPDEFGFGERLAAALVAANAGRFDDAGPFYRAAVKRDPKSAGEIALTWASRLLAAERPQDAVSVLRAEELRRETGLQAVLVDELLAAALELSGETDEAIELLRASIGRRPDSPRLRARLGWVLVHADRTAEAEDVYRALVAKYDDDYRRAEIRQILRDAKLALSACALERDALSDAPEEAEEWLEQVLDEFPDDPDALNDLAYSMGRSRRASGACRADGTPRRRGGTGGIRVSRHPWLGPVPIEALQGSPARTGKGGRTRRRRSGDL